MVQVLHIRTAFALALIFCSVVQATFPTRDLQVVFDVSECDDRGKAEDCEFKDTEDCDEFNKENQKYISCLVRACGKDAINCNEYNDFVRPFAEVIGGCGYKDVTCTIFPVYAIALIAVSAVLVVAIFFMIVCGSRRRGGPPAEVEVGAPSVFTDKI
mmetsp:Transcript_20239/g.24539  ORF Transcript_20239/g.24539 Transcript_20239/m.24539 type:complete len:157 (+) Transcript_20239:197-667(+)